MDRLVDAVSSSSSPSSFSSSRCFCLNSCLLLVHSDVEQSSTVTVHTLFIIPMFVRESTVCCLGGISTVRVWVMCVCVCLREGTAWSGEDFRTRELTQCDGIVHVLQCSLYPQPVLPLSCNSMWRVQQMTTTINCNAVLGQKSHFISVSFLLPFSLRSIFLESV